MAVGMAADLRHGLLFVAGGFTGQAYIYDLRTGATVASDQLTAPATSLLNDVAVTKDGAWFTDSFQPRLYFVPVNGAGVPAPRSAPLSSAARRPPSARSAGRSTSTASRPPPTARP
jgi:hypothetical protein